MLRDIQKIYIISQNYNLTDQKEVDMIYRILKKQGKRRFYTWIGKSFFEELKTKTSFAKYRRYAAFGIRQIGILAFLTAILLLGSGAAIRVQDHENKALQELLGEMKAQENTDRLPDAILQENPETDLARIDGGDMGNALILEEYQRFYDLNEDFAGWIKVEGTGIDYPVLQNKENPEIYLSHNFFKKEERSGAVFLDGVTSMMSGNLKNIWSSLAKTVFMTRDIRLHTVIFL